MAISVVGTAEGQKTDGTTITLTLPSMAANDVVFVFEGEASTAGPRGMSTGGYTNIGVDTDNSPVSFGGYYKKQGVSPDTTAVINAGAASVGHAAVAIVLRGVDPNTILDDFAQAGTGASASPNSPAATFNTTGACCISAAAKNNVDTSVVAPTSPVTFVNQVDIDSNTTAEVTVGAAVGLNITPGSVDPTGWISWTAGTNGPWVAFNVPVRPLIPPQINATFQGSGSLSVNATQPRHQGHATFSGAGNFQADVTQQVTSSHQGNVRFAGSGSMSVNTTSRLLISVDFGFFQGGYNAAWMFGQGGVTANTNRTDIETWPVDEEALVTSFTEEFEGNVVTFTPDTGPELVYRNRSTSTVRYNISTYLTFADYVLLRNFYRITVESGTLSFIRNNPITGADMECQFLSEPQARAVDNDQLLVTYSLRPVTP